MSYQQGINVTIPTIDTLSLRRFFIGTSCTSFPCQNNGICKYSLNDPYYKCKCLDGFSGKDCEGKYKKLRESDSKDTVKCKITKIPSLLYKYKQDIIIKHMFKNQEIYIYFYT